MLKILEPLSSSISLSFVINVFHRLVFPSFLIRCERQCLATKTFWRRGRRHLELTNWTIGTGYGRFTDYHLIHKDHHSLNINSTVLLSFSLLGFIVLYIVHLVLYNLLWYTILWYNMYIPVNWVITPKQRQLWNNVINWGVVMLISKHAQLHGISWSYVFQ